MQSYFADEGEQKQLRASVLALRLTQLAVNVTARKKEGEARVSEAAGFWSSERIRDGRLSVCFLISFFLGEVGLGRGVGARSGGV